MGRSAMLLPAAVDEKLRSFIGLRTGWHFGEGNPIPPRAIVAARRLLVGAYLRNSTIESDVFPGVNGEVRVCVYFNDDYFELTIEPDFSVTYRREQNDVEVGEPLSLNLTAACDRIISAIPKQCPSSASSPYGITMNLKSGGSIVWLSGLAQMTGQYQLLTKIASLHSQLQPVIMFGDTTQNSVPSSYDSSDANYRQAIG